MFSVEERERVLTALLDQAKYDGYVVAAAITGSMANDLADRWSDIDLFLGAADEAELHTVVNEWSAFVYRRFDALHHFDLHAPPAVYRAFLLPSCLEIDLGFTPASQFGPLGPHFRPIFGITHALAQPPSPDIEHVIGLCWHHMLHARTSIERTKLWQAEYWISALRDHVITLACLRLGRPTVHAKGADDLPARVTQGLEDGLVRSLGVAELRRALSVVASRFLHEVGEGDPGLAGKLEPPLRELAFM
jgi:predicted nucleotidyltransferase